MKMSERVKHGLYPINLIHYITEDELYDHQAHSAQLITGFKDADG
jgi:hypothetical protein